MVSPRLAGSGVRLRVDNYSDLSDSSYPRSVAGISQLASRPIAPEALGQIRLLWQSKRSCQAQRDTRDGARV